jgi:hypothetical protein
MDLKIRRFFILFSVLLVISITPACAVKMGDVADDASKYNIESKQKRGFFAKIKFIAKGFNLIDRAKNAEKDSNNNIKNSSDGEGYESLWEQNQLQQLKQKKLLHYRTSKGTKINHTNTENFTNDLNNTNVTENSSFPNDIIIPSTPKECYYDAASVIRQLGEHRNISLKMRTECEVNNNLTGNIVQIIDEKGHIRYLDVKSLNKSTITLFTAKKNEITMTINEFKKSFTGIVILDDNFKDHPLIIGLINELQKNEILQEAKYAQILKNKAKTDTIIDGILIGVGLVLFIVGIVLAVVFSRPASAKATLQMTDLGNDISDVLSSDSDEWSFTSSAVDNSDTPPLPPSGGSSPIPFPEVATSSSESSSDSPDIMNNSSNISPSPGLLFLLKSEKLKNGLCIGIASVSVLISVIASIELIISASSNTWIRFILGVVGLILIIVGTVFMIYGLHCGFASVGNLITSNELLKKIKNDSNDMDSWLQEDNLNNETVTPKNSTNNLNYTKLHNNTFFGVT